MRTPVMSALALLLSLSSATYAGVPEPDVIYFGQVVIGSQVQTTADPTTVEIRKTGQDPLSTGIEERGSGPIYVSRIGVENTAGANAGCQGFCATLGDSLEVWVVSGGSETHVAQLTLGARGRIVRLNLEVPTNLADLDVDGDGHPNFIDNCPSANPSQVDSDGDGIGDDCESSIPSAITVADSLAAVEDSGNPADPETGLGSVAYAYQIGLTEVTNAQYVEFLNAVAAADSKGLFSESMAIDPRGGIIRSGSYGAYSFSVKPQMADKPVNFVSWLDAARLANWLENGTPSEASSTEEGAFDLGVQDPAVNAVGSPSNWSLPIEHEWYKAAYYDPGQGYFDYPTGEDTQPIPATADLIGSVDNPGQAVANYGQSAAWNGQEGNVTSAGSAGSTTHYGSSDMGGNVAEWLADDASEEGMRKARGGSHADSRFALESAASGPDRERDPSYEGADAGVRLVYVPEAASSLMAAYALMTLAALRLRGSAR